jgi:hypothetical protein
MDTSWLRYAQKKEFKLPAPFLVRLKQLEPQVVASSIPPNVKQLRTNKLKRLRELREAALFCHGMSLRMGQPVYMADDESSDYDFIASWVVGGEQHFAPVQLKEVVPTGLNASSSIDAVISDLSKYASSENLTVAVHLNQALHFDPAALVVRHLKLAALWVFASVTADQTEWGLWGNFLEPLPQGIRFAYPVA